MSEQDPQIWQDVMQANVNATFMLTQSAVTVIAEVRCRLAGLYVTRWPSGTRQPKRLAPPSKFATEGMMQVLA